MESVSNFFLSSTQKRDRSNVLPSIIIESRIPFAGFFDFYKAKAIIDIGYKNTQNGIRTE
jgi:hypothetical protein